MTAILNAILYWTIWIALSLFAIGELGQRDFTRQRPADPWAWSVSALGLLLLVAHIAIAMSVRHDWSHASALASTATQTQAVYGINWGGGVYVNYLFVTVWTAELTVWRFFPERYAARSLELTWLTRCFHLIVIANAAIVFAAGWRRIPGAAIVMLLAAAWTRRRQGAD